jgi:putative inorganic carbon (HCO3(-)) transporter
MAFVSYPTTFAQKRIRAAELVPGILFALLSFLGIYRFGFVMVLGGLLAIGVLWWVMLKPAAATLTCVFVMYSNAAAVAVRAHHVPTPIAMGFFLLLFIPMLNYVVVRREGIRTDKVLGLMAVYFTILIASAVFSRNPGESAETIANYVLEGMVVYFLILNTVRSPEVLRRALWIVPLVAALLGALSAYQWLTKSYEKTYGGFSTVETVEASGVVARPTLETKKRGRDEEQLRAFGPVADPNFYGQILAAALPFALVPALAARSRRLRLAALAVCVPILAGVVLTYSRGAAISVVVFGVCMLFLRYFKVRHALLFAGVIALVIANNPDYRDRISTLSGVGTVSAEPSERDRVLILRAGVERVWEHPILGVGPGQSQDYIGTYDQDAELGSVRDEPLHNTYLQQLVETGIVGFTCFIAIIVITVRNLLRTSRYWTKKQPEYAHLTAALVLSLVAFLTASIFLHMPFVMLRYFALLLGLSGAATWIYRPEAPIALPAQETPPA